ncbi:MAG: ABC transporter ATP-binding protein [Lachnospiraceae bacterium]|nr:ABC transporter ATP-binding protein [Lachnospiraceae bacterium]
MSKIEIKHLSFGYEENKNHTPILKDINLSIEEGEFICILGPSGCGKSTLLSLLEGLNVSSEGGIYIDGNEIKGPGTDRAVVFQHYSLFPWLSAKKNIIFGIKQGNKKYSRTQRDELAEEYLKNVGLEEAGDKYPAQLSGGMQQRVAIARALAMEADILLMDEPFGAIDPKLRQELQELFSRLSKEKGKTVVFVTHDIDEAILLADRIVVMEPGKIRAEIPVTIPNPRKRDELAGTEEFQNLHRKLISLFYERVAQEIGNEEVVL